MLQRIRKLWSEQRHLDALLAAWNGTNQDIIVIDLKQPDLRELVFLGCRQAVKPGDNEKLPILEHLEHIIEDFAPPHCLTEDQGGDDWTTCRAAQRELGLLAHFLTTRALLEGNWCAQSEPVPSKDLDKIVEDLKLHVLKIVERLQTKRAGKHVHVPPITLGFVRDLTELLCGRPVRPAYATQEITVLLVEDESDGIPATLTLELVHDARDEIYAGPEMAFVCRRKDFDDALQTAWEYARRTLGLEGQKTSVRWRLSRRIRQENQSSLFDRLSGRSASAAFALGTMKLLTKADA